MKTQDRQKLQSLSGKITAVFTLLFLPALLWAQQVEFDCHYSIVTSAEISPDGQYVCSGSSGKRVIQWELLTGKARRSFSCEAAVNDLAFSPNGKLLAVATASSNVELWDIAERKQTLVRGHNSTVQAVAFSPEGRFLATAASDGTILLQPLNGIVRTPTKLEGHEGAVNDLAFSADGKYLLSCSDDCTARLWNLSSYRPFRIYRHERPVKAAAFNYDASRIATGCNDGSVILWKQTSTRALYHWKKHEFQVNSLAFSPDGNMLASGASDNSIMLWNMQTNVHDRTFYGHTKEVNAVAFSPNGKYIVSASADGLAKVWNQSSTPVSPHITNTTTSPEMPRIWAVIVGVAYYNHETSLRYADDDAQELYAFLKSPAGGALPDNQIIKLIDEDATYSGILSAMRNLYSKANANDLILFYFSGHGIEGAFLPTDYDGIRNQLAHTEVMDIFQKSPARHRLIIADACHSEMEVAENRSSGDNYLLQYYKNILNSSGGWALLMSSKYTERSIERGGWRHGVFSFFLIEGLKGAADNNSDGYVTLAEVADYVIEKVKADTRGYQTPVLENHLDPDLPLSVIFEN